MGWLWSSSSVDSSSQETASAPNDELPLRSAGLSEEQRSRVLGRPNRPQTTADQTRDQQADAELDTFIKSFRDDKTGTGRSGDDLSTSSPQSDVVQEPLHPSRILPDGSLDISPEVIYPRTMSCRQAFDQAFYCQSLGGKFNDIYRYGHLKSCSEQWGAFWFCMRTRTLPEKEKGERIAEYYRTRDDRRKEEFGSSEDIWEIRKVAVPRAFWKDPDLDDDDASAKVKE